MRAIYSAYGPGFALLHTALHLHLVRAIISPRQCAACFDMRVCNGLYLISEALNLNRVDGQICTLSVLLVIIIHLAGIDLTIGLDQWKIEKEVSPARHIACHSQ